MKTAYCIKHFEKYMRDQRLKSQQQDQIKCEYITGTGLEKRDNTSLFIIRLSVGMSSFGDESNSSLKYLTGDYALVIFVCQTTTPGWLN